MESVIAQQRVHVRFLPQSDDEAEALSVEAARPSSPSALGRDSFLQQTLVKSSSGSSLTPGAASTSPEPPSSGGKGSPSVPPLNVGGASASTARTSPAAAAAETDDGSDGDSPRYSAHPATTGIMQHSAGGGSTGSPASTGTNSPSVAAATGQRSSFKVGAPSWLQGGSKGDGAATPRAGSEAGARATALGRSVSNASAEAAAPSSPASSRGSRAGDTVLSDWIGDGAPGPSPLGLGSGRMTADQAAAAARILMAGGTLPGSPTQTNSPFARAQDGGHISFSSGGRGAGGPPARAQSQGRLGPAPRPAAADVSPATQAAEAPVAQSDSLGSSAQQPLRVRSETSLSRIGEDAAVVSTAADTTGAAAEQGTSANIPSTQPLILSTDPTRNNAQQPELEQGGRQVQAASSGLLIADAAASLETE